MMISYAQRGEDVVLDRVFGQQPAGFYADVGANDPIVDSVTQHFYVKGWSGINIEPLPDPFRRLAEARPKDINLNLAVSDRKGAQLFFKRACQSRSGLCAGAAMPLRNAYNASWVRFSIPSL